MADWDEDSAQLRNNLTQVLRDVRDSAVRRDPPTVQAARNWQANTMTGLEVPDARYVGRFRGEPGLENVRVWIGVKEGVAPEQVASELADFERDCNASSQRWMNVIPQGPTLMPMAWRLSSI